MYSVKVSHVLSEFNTDTLPLSAFDYISRAKGKARNERATGMLILNELLQQEGISDWSLDISENGKPFLVGVKLYFSVSHAGGACAVALSDMPIGIDLQDVERVERIKAPAAFVKRFFSAREYGDFLKSPTHAELCRLWTKKEALVKLLGLRLGDSIFSVSTLDFPNINFKTEELFIDKKFVITIAIQEKQK